MVQHHVPDDFNTALVALPDQGTELFIRTEAPVYPVVIGEGIAVVGVAQLVVFEFRIEPYGRHAQINQVIEVISDALQVAPMPAHQGIPLQALQHARHVIVARIAIGKTIREDQIHHILRARTLRLRLVITRQQWKLMGKRVTTLRKNQRHPLRQCLNANIQRYKQVLRAIPFFHLDQFHTAGLAQRQGISGKPGIVD